MLREEARRRWLPAAPPPPAAADPLSVNCRRATQGGAVADPPSVDRRNQALAALKRANPGLNISYTLPVLPTGLTADGVNLLRSAVANGFVPDVINVMAMDFGDSAAPNPKSA